jgi:hypothetical protein
MTTYEFRKTNGKASQLEGELRSARGLPSLGWQSYWLGDPGEHNVLILFIGVLTQEQIVNARDVVDRHTPDWTEENERVELLDLFHTIKGSYADWDTMTAAQKNVLLKKVLRLLLLRLKDLE